MLGLSKEGDEHVAHFTLDVGTGTFYLTFTLQLIGEFSLALSYANPPLLLIPKQKSDICLRKVGSFGFLPQKNHTPPPPAPSAMLLLWENSPLGKKKRPRHIRDGMENAVGGGETPRLWGGKLASSVCCDYVAFVLFFQIVTAPGSAVVNVSLPCSMVCFII